jgi:hypothetical protein
MFEPSVTRIGNIGSKVRFTAKCCRCDAEKTVEANKVLPDEVVNRKLKQAGWLIAKARAHDICPSCLKVTNENHLAAKFRVVKNGEVVNSPAEIVEKVAEKRRVVSKSMSTLLDKHFKPSPVVEQDKQEPVKTDSSDDTAQMCRRLDLICEDMSHVRAANELTVELVNKLVTKQDQQTSAITHLVTLLARQGETLGNALVSLERAMDRLATAQTAHSPKAAEPAPEPAAAPLLMLSATNGKVPVTLDGELLEKIKQPVPNLRGLGNPLDSPRNPERVQRVFELRAEGLTLNEIARRVGISGPAVQYLLTRWSGFADGSPKPAIQGLRAGDFDKAETTNTKTGKKVYVARMTRQLDRDDYESAQAFAQIHGGNYSRWRGVGAVPGFHFSSNAAREKFLAQVAGTVTPKPAPKTVAKSDAVRIFSTLQPSSGRYFSTIRIAKNVWEQAKLGNKVSLKIEGNVLTFEADETGIKVKTVTSKSVHLQSSRLGNVSFEESVVDVEPKKISIRF